ncbi:hypothetical protein ACVIHH_001315 [Bradyrhizobium sp. USDA 4518]
MFGAHEPDDNSFALGVKAKLPNLIRTVFRLPCGVAGLLDLRLWRRHFVRKGGRREKNKSRRGKNGFHASLLIGDSTKRL